MHDNELAQYFHNGNILFSVNKNYDANENVKLIVVLAVAFVT